MLLEIYEEGIGAVIIYLLISIVITLFAYGSFPIIFSGLRKNEISKRKYRLISYGVNFAIMLVMFFLNGGAANAAPYFLWTWVFTAIGIKILDKKEILYD